jgi:anti-sigma B factor antagonist
MLAVKRDDSAVLPGMFRLAVNAEDDSEPAIRDVNGAFALLGRTEGCCCHLDHPGVARRHAYLQSLYGRIYCVDLCGSTFWGDVPKKGGWLDPQTSIRIGPYQVRLIDAIGLGGGQAELPGDFNPLDQYAGQLGPLPRIEIEFLTGLAAKPMTITRPITLVGSSARCKLRLQDKTVSSVHCSLVWLTDGLWVVDLAGKGGTRVRNKSVRCAKLADGQRFRVGAFLMRVRSSGEMAFHGGETDNGRSMVSPQFSSSPKASPEGAGDRVGELVRSDLDPSWSIDELDIGRLSSREPVQADDQAGDVDDEEGEGAAEGLKAERDPRLQQIEMRETKLGEAQQRLAAEWDRLHGDRAALASINEALAQKEKDLSEREARVAAETESLAKERDVQSGRAAELVELQQRLKGEWDKLVAARARTTEARQQLVSQREELAQLREELKRRDGASSEQESRPPENELEAANPQKSEGEAFESEAAESHEVESPRQPDQTVSNAQPPEDEGVALVAMSSEDDPADFDALEPTRHNAVFRTEREGTTLIVTPLGDAPDFHYGIVHVESNKVRRLLEGGVFENLVVDLGHAPVFSAVMINVVVSLSRIAANRGGRAVLCEATEKTRGVLQSMRLLELWPLFTTRDEALQTFR